MKYLCLNLDNKAVTSIVLWNPATRKHSHIPNPQLSLVSGESDTVLRGFAYDHKTSGYKVVRVLFLSSSEVAATVRVEIYNTGINTWRTTEIVSFPVNCGWSISGVLVGGGTLYWFLPCGELGFQQDILSFDAPSEAFRFHFIAPGDKKPYPSDWYSWSLEAMGEHPALIYYEYNDEYYEGWCIARINIGKLNKCDDGGKDDSFHIEKLTIKPLLGLDTVFRICGNGKVIAQDPDGKVLFYDREETKYLPRELWSGNSEFYDYTESLVWPSRLA